jgi:transposase
MRPEEAVEVWAMDEHRVGLQPIIRRVWAPKGVRPHARVRPAYQWSYVYGFVRPHTGETYWLLMPTVSGAAFTAALAEFAGATGVGAGKRIILVLDGAGWHGGRGVTIPPGVHLVTLPPYAPELQPVERVWTLTDEPLANRTFADIEELETVQAARCLALRDARAMIRSHTRFHWWPAA